jgi:hypothetical protein
MRRDKALKLDVTGLSPVVSGAPGNEKSEARSVPRQSELDCLQFTVYCETWTLMATLLPPLSVR